MTNPFLTKNEVLTGIGVLVLAAGAGNIAKLRSESNNHIHEVLDGTEVAGAYASERAHGTVIDSLQNHILAEETKILGTRAEHIQNIEHHLNAGQKPGTYEVKFENGKYVAVRKIVGPFGTGVNIPNE